MKDKLTALLTRYQALQADIAKPEVINDQNRYRELRREYNELAPIAEEYTRLLKVEQEIENTEQLMHDEKEAELKELAQDELKELNKNKQRLENSLKLLLIPKDPLDLKNIIMEIRAGTGGEEAALFAADLFRMYSRYAESMKWQIEILSSSNTGIGGFKEVIFSIMGKNVYADLRYESGVHRVQRVPVTESGGRIHTSAVTVAVLPEAEETDIKIKQEELRVDVFRSSGPGGQSVNTTDSAVRITHLPTNLVVTCQDEKSQHKNKAKALRVLRARLYELEERRKQEARAKDRRSQIGSGDRSERIRTYNYPQNRVTDHRINLTLYKLELVLFGEMDEIIQALKLNAQEMLLKAKS
ncbi:MAG: peptide chain release factor 1 [Spirochaetales bacterium]|nr:peptide chain release factor 1 [Spirochaetales bacterium]